VLCSCCSQFQQLPHRVAGPDLPDRSQGRQPHPPAAPGDHLSDHRREHTPSDGMRARRP